MSVNTYFERYAFSKIWLAPSPHPKIGLIIAIPAFNEESVLPALQSLRNCVLPPCHVEVIVIINGPENASEKTRITNLNCYQEAQKWSLLNSSENLRFHIVLADNLSPKDHGVGIARKIGMDEALRRFEKAGNVHNGIIACFDADSSCSSNYFIALYEHFQKYPDCPGISIYYEHDLNQITDQKLLSGIIQYELHLRYYINAQRYAGFPHAYHTVGSSIAVKAEAYYKQGGMNKRKAGEDFYFLHKIIALGNFMDLKSAIIFPEARVSDRVPFGTGKALSEWMKGKADTYYTYNPKSFSAVNKLFSSLNKLYSNPENEIEFLPNLRNFLEKESFPGVIKDIKSRTSDFLTFKKRFYSWFNGFKMMKYLHFSRDEYYENLPVEMAAKWLLSNNYGIHMDTSHPGKLLDIYRKIDKMELEKISQ